MKPIALAIALLMTSAAYAQAPAATAKKSDQPVAAKAAGSAPTSVPGGQDVTPAISQSPGVFTREINPFTGKPLSGEELTARLEASKLLTAQLEEQLKQVTLAGEIAGTPVRKSADIATARAAQRTEELKLAAVEAQAADAARARADAARARADAEKAAKAAAKEEARRKKAGLPTVAQEAAAAAPVVVARPVLLSVMKVGGSNSAMFEHNGATMLIADGENSPMGVVKVIDDRTVHAGSAEYKVSSATLSRFATPAVLETASARPTAVATPAGAPGTSAAPRTATRTAASTPPLNGSISEEMRAQIAAESAAVTGLSTQASGSAARLPPLQIPPGVQVLPSAGR